MDSSKELELQVKGACPEMPCFIPGVLPLPISPDLQTNIVHQYPGY
jgi:hypothetical protein